MKRPCLSCGKPVSGSYCTQHDPKNAYKDPEYRRNKRAANQRDGFACIICGTRKKLGTHHIIPLKHGGSHAVTDLATMCRPHHDAAERGEIDEATIRSAIGQ